VIDLLLPFLQQVSNLSALETRENSMSASLVLTTRSHSQVSNLICDEPKFQSYCYDAEGVDAVSYSNVVDAVVCSKISSWIEHFGGLHSWLCDSVQMAELSVKLDEIYLLPLEFCRIALMLIWTL
jgi:hypothetical protein